MKIPNDYNITAEIIQHAESLGLDAIGTGGGMDYICKNLEGDKLAVLSASDDAGSPERLKDHSTVSIWQDASGDGTTIAMIHFESAEAAMRAMAAMRNFEVVATDP